MTIVSAQPHSRRLHVTDELTRDRFVSFREIPTRRRGTTRPSSLAYVRQVFRGCWLYTKTLPVISSYLYSPDVNTRQNLFPNFSNFVRRFSSLDGRNCGNWHRKVWRSFFPSKCSVFFLSFCLFVCVVDSVASVLRREFTGKIASKNKAW